MIENAKNILGCIFDQKFKTFKLKIMLFFGPQITDRIHKIYQLEFLSKIQTYHNFSNLIFISIVLFLHKHVAKNCIKKSSKFSQINSWDSVVFYWFLISIKWLNVWEKSKLKFICTKPITSKYELSFVIKFSDFRSNLRFHCWLKKCVKKSLVGPTPTCYFSYIPVPKGI